MKLCAWWAVAVLMVGVGTASSLGAEDLASAVTVSAIDARVLETGLPWAPRSGGACSVSLQVRGGSPGARVLVARVSRVARMSDDTGRDLWPVPEPMIPAEQPVLAGQAGASLSDMQAWSLQVWGLRAPAQAARSVRAVGAVTVLLGIGTEETRLAGVRLERGQRIAAGDVSLQASPSHDDGPTRTVATSNLEHLPDNVDWVLGLDEPTILYEDTFPPGKAEGDSDKPAAGSLNMGSSGTSDMTVALPPPGGNGAAKGGMKLRLLADHEIPDLAGLDFYDAEGKKVEAQVTGHQSTWVSHEGGPMQKLVVIDMHLSREIDVADVVVRRWKRIEEVEVPFTLDVPLERDDAAAPRRELKRGPAHAPYTVAELLPPEGAPLFRASALRMPYAYVMDKDGGLYVYRLPERGWATGLRPVFTVPDAGDGIDLEAVGDALLCSRAGALEVYTLGDPARPAHVGRVGPQEARQSADIATDGQRFYLVCRHAIVAYDVSTPSRPKLLGEKTIVRTGCSGLVSDGYLYVGTGWDATGGAPGVAGYDVSDRGHPLEVGFAPTEAPVWHLFALSRSGLLANLEGTSTLTTFGPAGGTALLGLASAGHPRRLVDIPRGGGRAPALLSADGTDIYLALDATYLVRQHDLARIAWSPLLSAPGEGFPCRCGADGTRATIVTDRAVIVKTLH